jgi:hypothetical protein
LLDQKEAKNQVSKKASLPHIAFAPQTVQNHGLESFALLRSLFPSLLQKLLCPCHAQGHHCSVAFARSCFADAEKGKKNPY